MADLYRYSISSSDKLVPISSEIRHVHNYLDIMQVRYGERLCPHFFVDEAASHCLIMKLTLQPLVENAIYHGLEAKRSHGDLNIRVWAQDSFVCVSIEDNGVGMNSNQLKRLREKLSPLSVDSYKSNGHIGLVNVYQRLRLRFGDDCAMILESQEDVGTKVTVRVTFSVPGS